MTISDSHQLASSDLHLRIGLLKPFLTGAKKTRLGPIPGLVLFLSVGADYNREDCCLSCTINKDQNSKYSCVSFDVTNVGFDTNCWTQWPY